MSGEAGIDMKIDLVNQQRALTKCSKRKGDGLETLELCK